MLQVEVFLQNKPRNPLLPPQTDVRDNAQKERTMPLSPILNCLARSGPQNKTTAPLFY